MKGLVILWFLIEWAIAAMHFRELDGWVTQLVHLEGVNPVGPSNPQSFNYVPQKQNITSIDTASLSLAGFKFGGFLPIFHWNAYINILSSTTLQISLTADYPTLLVYLKYYVLCVDESINEYLFIVHEVSSLSSINSDRSANGSQNVYLSLPAQRFMTSMTTATTVTFYSFKGTGYGSVSYLRLGFSSLSYQSSNHTLRVTIYCQYGSVHQVGLTVVVFNFTQARTDSYPLFLKYINYQSPRSITFGSGVSLTTLLENQFSLPAQIKPFYHKIFFRFTYFYFYASFKVYDPEFSFDLDEEGFSNIKINLQKDRDTFSLSSVTIALVQCDSPNEYFLAGSNACSFCTLPPHCVLCNSTTTCAQCEDGYFLDAGQTVCTTCPFDNCLTCVDLSECEICSVGYFKNAGLNCELCSNPLPQCLQCSDDATCIKCSPGYYTQGLSCLSCFSTLSNCLECESSSACSTCQSGFYISSIGCDSCSVAIPNCLTCSNETNCLSCSATYYPNNSSCLPCSRAIRGCIDCENGVICKSCVADYFFLSLQGKCQSCDSLMTNCLKCLNQYLCITCKVGYFSIGPECLKCSDIFGANCLKCSSSSACDKLYQTSSSNASPISINTSGLTHTGNDLSGTRKQIQDLLGVIFGIIAMIVIIIGAAVAFGVYIFKKMKPSEELNAQENESIFKNAKKDKLDLTDGVISFEELEKTQIPSLLNEPRAEARRRRKRNPLKKLRKDFSEKTMQPKIQKMQVNQIVFDKELQQVQVIRA